MAGVNDFVAFGQRGKFRVFVSDDVNAKIFFRALFEEKPISVDGGERRNFFKNIFVDGEKFFECGIFSGERSIRRIASKILKRHSSSEP